ncbi:uncharacterized protein L199_000191 [Kwoniella botswanensis]|uniref:uncharacterized protein n=1 Tax=Kwoniella botswanensis TaxID=1268659 RepID=UPI00315D3B74
MSSPARHSTPSGSTSKRQNGVRTPMSRPAIAAAGMGRITPRSACESCRTRKIKCTGERPICARCQKQGKECVYANATTSWSGGSGVSPIPDPPAVINVPPPKPSLLVASDRSILPARRHIHELLSHYFLYTNAAFPIFHIPTLQRQVDAVCFSDESVARFDIAVVLYALAIGAASLDQKSLSDPAIPLRAEEFFHHAVKYVLPGMGWNGIESLQIQVAHLIFVLYKPGCGNAWESAGFVARQAIGLGLHQEA